MKLSVWTTASAAFEQASAVDKSKKPSPWRLYLAVILMNVVSFACGTVYGWSAVVLPFLQSENSPIGIPPITDGDASWLASIYCLSRPMTIPFYKYSNDRFGRKVTGYCVAIPLIIGYLMMLFANSSNILFWARFITGVSTGGSFILVPSYCSDIAEDHNKGKLGIIFGLAMNLGMCFTYIMVYLTSYRVFHVCCIVLPVASIFIIWWLPESPLFLMTTGKTDEARRSLKWLRSGEETDFEIERMKRRAEEVLEKRNRKISFSEITNTPTLRGFLICIGITINKSFNGYGPISGFSVQIFQDAGSTMSPNVATILLGLVEMFGMVTSCFTIEKSGRRFILITSNIFMAGCMIVIGAYFYLQVLGWNLEAIGWIPVVSLCLYELGNGVGVGPVPHIIPTELVHSHYLGAVQSTNMILMSVLYFASTYSYNPLVKLMGQYGCFWLYAIICITSAFCIFFTLPETKKRSLEEVLEQLGSKQFIRSVLHYRAKKDTEKISKRNKTKLETI